MRPDLPLTNVMILHRPEAGICIDRLHRGPRNYASQLARYIRDASKVRALTMNEWGRAPSLEECRELIADAHAQRAAYRAESERLGECDRDEAHFRPAPTSTALDMQRSVESAEANRIELPDLSADDVPTDVRPFFIDDAVEAIARAMKVTVADIMGPDRAKVFMQARQVAYWVLHQRGQSTAQIGRRLNRDHSSVINSLRRYETHATPRMRLVAEWFAGAERRAA